MKSRLNITTIKLADYAFLFIFFPDKTGKRENGKGIWSN